MVIRKATKKDLQEVQKLNLKLLKKEKKEYDSLLDLNWVSGKEGIKHYKDRISKGDGCVLVAIVDCKIVGYLCGKLAKKGFYGRLPTIVVAELETTFVLDKFRSKGIGKKLYNKFIEWCKTKNVNKIMLEASPKNKLAIKFYKNNNFKDYSSVLEADI